MSRVPRLWLVFRSAWCVFVASVPGMQPRQQLARTFAQLITLLSSLMLQSPLATANKA